MIRPGWPALHGIALLGGAALAAHELRYRIAFGGEAEQTLAGYGHGYLGPAGIAIGVLSAVVLGRLLARLAGAPRHGSTRRRRVRVLWPAASVALLGIYVGQEVAEGVLAHGHPGGWHGVFGSGGWLACPLAVVFGALVAIGVRVSELIESSRHRPRVPAARVTPAPVHGLAPATVVAIRKGRAVADHLAGRGPPPLAV